MSKTAKEILKENRLLSSYWGRRIVKAEERGYRNKTDALKASSWQTCACGRQDDRIPRDDEGVPMDSALSDLGCSFYVHILNNRFDFAAQTLVKIERRAAEVLREVTQ
jgi:hypothetical protein